MGTPQIDAGRNGCAPSTATFDSLNPSTGDVVAAHPVHGSADVEAAVAAARDAAVWWAGLGFAGRARRLAMWAGVITRRMDELIDVVHTETGKPRGDAQLEIVLAIEHIAWAGRHASKVLGPHRRSPGLLMANFAATVRVRAAGRRRRDRAVELPGVHADGIDRLRAGRRQRRGVQAERVHARRRRVAGEVVRRGGHRSSRCCN